MSSRLSDKNNVGQRMSSVECLVEKGILHVPSFLWEGVRLATCVLHQETGADRWFCLKSSKIRSPIVGIICYPSLQWWGCGVGSTRMILIDLSASFAMLRDFVDLTKIGRCWSEHLSTRFTHASPTLRYARSSTVEFPLSSREYVQHAHLAMLKGMIIHSLQKDVYSIMWLDVRQSTIPSRWRHHATSHCKWCLNS